VATVTSYKYCSLIGWWPSDTLSTKDIALELGISKERVGHIINLLGLKKVCARWVPQKLTDEMKAEKVRGSMELLGHSEDECVEFLRRIVIGDETCVHHYDPENKRQSMEYRHKESPAPTKPTPLLEKSR
jgi:histone-lysine N-methyltransferase SETMAR